MCLFLFLSLTLLAATAVHSRPVGAGGIMAPPDFGRSVNPNSRGGGILCPPNYYLTSRIFRPSYGTAAKGTLTNVMDSGEAPSPSQAEKWGHRLTACTLG